ncbi:Hypothetical protein SMAX5B_014679 [Scophthalmus maximus]|uniref:Uncharacterized protein n=1 Tax=Scophthalmus maximus TaxID=52904 RepID=A0A2U9C1S0_SCOMX|nr:Hypothetical protein SMAX5B_014679 [Scophthalmus maximus]
MMIKDDPALICPLVEGHHQKGLQTFGATSPNKSRNRLPADLGAVNTIDKEINGPALRPPTALQSLLKSQLSASELLNQVYRQSCVVHGGTASPALALDTAETTQEKAWT